MNLRVWSHKNGFRSPTEQQLVRWETDGGNYRECEDAVLCEGRLYSCSAELFRARMASKIKKVVGFLQTRLEARMDHQPSPSRRP